jgi:glycosyltransferase involved in cell wall biosynthesis
VAAVSDPVLGPHTTVVLPTFRRPEGIRRVLESLARQSDPGTPWDVVVIDNDDAPGAQTVFDEVAPKIPTEVRLVRERKRGASNARNRGIAEAGGDVIAFVDDDVVPDDDWLARIVEPIRSGRCSGTGGRVILDPTVPRPGWFEERRLAGYLAAYDLGSEEVPVPPDHYVLTANAAFTTASLREIGGLDPVLGPRSGVPLVNDDVDLCRRLMAAGHHLRYVPSAVVVHELPLSRLQVRYVVRRLYAQGRSDWLMDRTRLRELRLRGLGSLGSMFWRYVLHGLWELSYGAGFAREAVKALTRAEAPGSSNPQR